jgi:L-arabinose isomerase
MKEYTDKYTMKTDRIDSVREQAKYEVGLEKFLSTNGIGAFADTFQDLHGLKQLPGIAAQNLMGKGIGFGPEGDYKISALSAVLMKMSEGKEGATGFIEDYTYDLTPGQELELASHMLEVPPAFAATKPEIDVIPLGIGGGSGKTDLRRRDRRWYPGNDGRYGRSFPHHLCRYRACKTAETDAKTSGSENYVPS